MRRRTAPMPHSLCLNKSKYTAKVFKEVIGTLDENLTIEIVNNYEFERKVVQKGYKIKGAGTWG
jgi:hypothetical protein